MADNPAEPWFRTYYIDVVRWVGLTMFVVLVGCLLFTDIPYERVAGGFPLATGLIFLKEIPGPWRNGRSR